MRAYVPVGWDDLAALEQVGTLPGPRRACVVDPAWRAGAVDVDEEEWEFEAQQQAAGALAEGGVVLAVEADTTGEPDDGWVELPGPVLRREVRAVLTADLAWFAAHEVADLLAQR